MTRRETFIAQMTHFADEGDELVQSCPEEAHADLPVLRARVAVLRRIVAEAAVKTDAEWELVHPAPGTWHYRWRCFSERYLSRLFSRRRENCG